MHSWKEEFGSFSTSTCDWIPRKEIFMGYNDSTTGEEMVITAIRLAKRYNCKIVGPVRFKPEMVGGTVSFIVECHSLTYRYFYEGGRTNRLHDSEVRDSDIKRYEELFGTRKCLDEGFRKQFWFTDNWDGSIHRYASLRKAKTEAKTQTGVSCCIHESLPYGRGSRIVCFAPASGFTPP